MNLLLLLSAIIAALSGAVTGGRLPQTQQVMVRQAPAISARVASPVRVTLPIQTEPTLAEIAQLIEPSAEPAPTPAVALYADRRRE